MCNIAYYLAFLLAFLSIYVFIVFVRINGQTVALAVDIWYCIFINSVLPNGKVCKSIPRGALRHIIFVVI